MSRKAVGRIARDCQSTECSRATGKPDRRDAAAQALTDSELLEHAMAQVPLMAPAAAPPPGGGMDRPQSAGSRRPRGCGGGGVPPGEDGHCAAFG